MRPAPQSRPDVRIGRGPSVTAIDLSCSALIVATEVESVVLSPAVTTVSEVADVLAAGAAVDALPAGSRLLCSDQADQVLAARPERCEEDPLATVDSARAQIAGLSVPVTEVLAAPVIRALRWAGTRVDDPVVILVPSHWGTARLSRLSAALRTVHGRVVPIRAALATVEAMSAASARWIVVAEGMPAAVVLTLVHRGRSELRIVDRSLVHRVDPVVDRLEDSAVTRIAQTAIELRRAHREARSASFEVLARGVGAVELVRECDRLRVPSFLVPTERPAEAAVGLSLSLGNEF